MLILTKLISFCKSKDAKEGLNSTRLANSSFSEVGKRVSKLFHDWWPKRIVTEVALIR